MELLTCEHCGETLDGSVETTSPEGILRGSACQANFLSPSPPPISKSRFPRMKGWDLSVMKSITLYLEWAF